MKDRTMTAILFLTLFVVLILSATVNVMQSVQIKAINEHIEAMNEHVEILGLEADTCSAYMRDQNTINYKLIAMLEQDDAVPNVP